MLWKPASSVVLLALVEHPTRGCCVLMCGDLTLAPIDIFRLCGLRFKRETFRIEFGFKQVAHVIGTFVQHFWMRKMKPLERHYENQYLHKELSEYRQDVRPKPQA